MSIANGKSNYTFKFIGRQTELGIFSDLLGAKSPRKALYVEAGGGVGKTKLLNEFVRTSRDAGWNLGPDDRTEELLIDFHALDNRTVSGLRRNIVNRIGDNYFSEYISKDNELKSFSLIKEEKAREGRIAALSLEMRSIFLKELTAISTVEIKPTALFFDTFELICNREVGRWFLQDFIPLANKLGLLIVFVGREREFNLPSGVYKHVLKNFEKTQEYDEYFKEHAGALSTNEENLYYLSSGKPLLVELMRFLEWDDFSDELIDIAKNIQTRHVFEGRLIQGFVNTDKENSFLKVILEMSYLKRRFTKQIFEHRHAHYAAIKNWAHLKEELAAYPFVKYYPASDSFVLHDEFQGMIEEYGRGTFREKALELYNDVVKDQYEKMINEADFGDIKNLLRVEQLAYILNIRGNHDRIAPDYGFAKEKLVEYDQSRSHVLDGFLVSEISTDILEGFPDEERDEVLSMFGRMAQRIYRYEEALPYWESVAKFAKSKNNYTRQVEALIRLHTNAWRSNPTQAFEVLDQAFEIANAHAKTLLPRVLNAIGVNYDRFRRYEEAIEYYQKALANIIEVDQKQLKATILNNLGDSYLEIGKIARAKAHINSGRMLRQEVLDNLITNNLEDVEIAEAESRIGFSYVILGKLARYSNDLADAEAEYSRAISIFEKNNNQSARANALLDRGETYRRMARLSFETGQLDPVKLNEEKAEKDIQIGFDLCQQYGLVNLLDTAYRRRGRLLHDQGYRAVETANKLKYYDKALLEFENALEIALRTSDVREELENLREIAFIADDHAYVVINNEIDKKKIQEEYGRLVSYIARFESGLKKYENDEHRLYNYDVFKALLVLEKAAFAYAQRSDQALDLYIQAYLSLAKMPGYGVSNYLIYLPHLFKNIRNLKNPKLEKEWCGKIRTAWESAGLDQMREEMIANIEVHLLGLEE